MRNKRLLSVTLLFVFLCIGNFQCSKPTEVTGGSEVGNPSRLAGNLKFQDGEPASGAQVYLRPADYLPSVSAKIGERSSFKTLDSTRTDSLGNFAFDSIAAGTYTLECLNGEPGSGALIDSVVIDHSDSTTELVTDTLKPLGSIMGQIQLPESLNASQVRVLVYGLDRAVEPDSAGQYTISDLAEGTYSLRIQASADQSVDVSNVSVPTGDTTWAPSTAVPGDHRAYASKATGAVIMDGRLDEPDWAACRAIRFSNPAVSENQVVVRALWDSVYLYIAYDVTDSFLAAVPDTDDASFDDGAEIYLDPDHDAAAQMNADDLGINVNIIDESVVLNQGQLIRSIILNKTHWTGLGYSMEFAVPWTLIQKTPSENLLMGVLFANNDRDGFGREQSDWLGLKASGIINQRPDRWGDLILLP